METELQTDLYTHVFEIHVNEIASLPYVREQNLILQFGRQSFLFVECIEELDLIYALLVHAQSNK